MDPQELRFTRTHEWVHLDGDIATVGISDFAVKELTDIVHLEFPKVGSTVKAGQPFGEIESVKSVNDLYAPVSGVVAEVNPALQADLGLLGQDPFGKAWIARIKTADATPVSQLLDYAAYQASCAAH
jgi:glycine cleavage system H protein